MSDTADWAREGLAEWLRMTLGAATVIADEALEDWPRENSTVFPSFGAAGFAEENDPESMLDRIKATSRIIDLHEPRQVSGQTVCAKCSEPWPCPTLRWLAWGYRRSYGWQPEWAPEGA